MFRVFFPAVLTALVWCGIACGLEVYVQALLPPTDAVLPQSGTSDDTVIGDPSGRYFNFRTSETKKQGNYTPNVDSQHTFIGTTVFYKIYNSFSSMDSDRRSIDNANSELSSAGYERLESLKFQKLNDSDAGCLVPQIGGEQSIAVRLYTEGNYAAEISCTPANEKIPKLPKRYNGNSFDFFKKNGLETDKKPDQSDEDYKYSSSRDESRFYILAYAASMGFDAAYVSTYSELLYIGFISIDKNDFE
ncbi:MAG: hypothetical protein NC041_04915 [Bacteroides sp.]|nr:hypothetical protein [Prevotella sp.]MCM1407300.1 hypothetical protein [Treponema brennaborense]MCM1469788.1 hypothetical protein [Bacteroides sp.]